MKKNKPTQKATRIPDVTKIRKEEVTIRLDETAMSYFREQARLHGIPYPSFIALFLGKCAESKRKLTVQLG